MIPRDVAGWGDGPCKLLYELFRYLRAMGTQGEQDDSQRSEFVPLWEVIQVFEQRDDQARPVTASDVMEAVGCSRRTAHNKLNELVDQGMVETRKVGSRSRVWWIPIEELAEPAVERLVQEMDLPGTGKKLEARREALLTAYRYLQQYPEAKKSDFLQEVFPENPAGYETAEGWWNTIQPALAQLPGVDPPKERGHIWHFLGG